jgi:hypothetical protein
MQSGAMILIGEEFIVMLLFPPHVADDVRHGGAKGVDC